MLLRFECGWGVFWIGLQLKMSVSRWYDSFCSFWDLISSCSQSFGADRAGEFAARMPGKII
jgi:hypothetical protein